jgi:hypothetical protein
MSQKGSDPPVTPSAYTYILICLFFIQDEMTKFHSDDYIKFLRSIRPDNMSEYSKLLQR